MFSGGGRDGSKRSGEEGSVGREPKGQGFPLVTRRPNVGVKASGKPQRSLHGGYHDRGQGVDWPEK